MSEAPKVLIVGRGVEVIEGTIEEIRPNEFVTVLHKLPRKSIPQRQKIMWPEFILATGDVGEFGTIKYTSDNVVLSSYDGEVESVEGDTVVIKNGNHVSYANAKNARVVEITEKVEAELAEKPKSGRGRKPAAKKAPAKKSPAKRKSRAR